PVTSGPRATASSTAGRTSRGWSTGRIGGTPCRTSTAPRQSLTDGPEARLRPLSDGRRRVLRGKWPRSREPEGKVRDRLQGPATGWPWGSHGSGPGSALGHEDSRGEAPALIA